MRSQWQPTANTSLSPNPCAHYMLSVEWKVREHALKAPARSTARGALPRAAATAQQAEQTDAAPCGRSALRHAPARIFEPI